MTLTEISNYSNQEFLKGGSMKCTIHQRTSLSRDGQTYFWDMWFTVETQRNKAEKHRINSVHISISLINSWR
jgi:hypothetical protein